MKDKSWVDVWTSREHDVVVSYNKFALGNKYSIYLKVRYAITNKEVWEYVTSFDTIGEAIIYAKMMLHRIVVR